MEKHTKACKSNQKPEKSAILQCWESAVSSRIARFQAVPEILKRTETDVFGSNKFSLVSAMSDEVNAGVTSFTEIMNAVLPKLNKATQTERAANAEGERLVLCRLKEGQLRAFAFEKPRSIKDNPVELDWQVIAGCERFDWDGGALKKDSMNFVEVRFMETTEVEWIFYKNEPPDKDWQSAVDLPTRNEISAASKQDFAESKPVGRPSVSKHISDALLALHNSGEIDFQKSMKSHYPLIRRWLAQNYPDLHVTDCTPGVEVMRRVASPFFKAHKQKTQKL